MTLLECLTVANLLATGALGWLVVRRTKPKPAHAAPRTVAVGEGAAATLGHYEVGYRKDDGHTVTLYAGPDSDAAYKAHVELERNPAKYPGRHFYDVNGERKVSRHHTEMV